MKTKGRILICSLTVMGLVLVLTDSCKKDKPTVPEITTTAVTAISSKTAVSGGLVTNDGGATVTTCGVCWSTGQTPTTGDSKTTDGTGSGNFSSTITGLSPNTNYNVRAYAINSAGTGYGNKVSFTTKEAVTDLEGNVYSIVTIGTQVWMAENLKTTKYNDNTDIPLVTDDTEWGNLSTPGYCWYNNDAAANKNNYGALYNWYTVNTGKLCPTGWHAPTDAEWTTLTIYLGGDVVAGGKLKESGTTHWITPNTGATNESGFTALPSGARSYTDGAFSGVGTAGYWWSSTEVSTTNAWLRGITFDYSDVGQASNGKHAGYSVRCLQD